MKRGFVHFLLFLSAMTCAFFCPSIPSPQAVDLPLAIEFARHDNNIVAAVNYSIPGEYHAYANSPGNMGLPTRLDFTLEGEGSVPVLYPPGKTERDIFNPKSDVNIYSGDVTLLAVLPVNGAGELYVATLDMLLCSKRHCMPYKQSLTGLVPLEIPPLLEVAWKKEALGLLKKENESSGTHSSEQVRGSSPMPGELATGRSEKSSGIESPADFDLRLSPQYANEDVEINNLGKALLLGLLAGLLLNAMPCVLPVITLKVSGLLLIGNADHKKQLARFRSHNIFFAAGILTLFTVLAIALGAADLMWGQFYQSQTIVLLMLMAVFLMGLSMLGVFTLPALDLRLGEHSQNPRLKAFCAGLVSTFLATPCSGPLLGGVLAWAFTQSMPVLLAIFWSVGLGMALPYIVFCVWPNMTRILPRPGKWMSVFEHVVGFLLLATALYLLSILPDEKHMRILAVLLVLSAGAWLWGKFCGLSAPATRRRVLGVTALALIGCAVFWVSRPLAPNPVWQNFSPNEFAADLGKKNMLVEFTADWCPNCKFLEATVLSNTNLRRWQKRYGLELVKVDLTRHDAYAQRLLNMLGGKSIPLTAIFSKGEDSTKPMVLRDLYGKNTLNDALRFLLDNS